MTITMNHILAYLLLNNATASNEDLQQAMLTGTVAELNALVAQALTGTFTHDGNEVTVDSEYVGGIVMLADAMKLVKPNKFDKIYLEKTVNAAANRKAFFINKSAAFLACFVEGAQETPAIEDEDEVEVVDEDAVADEINTISKANAARRIVKIDAIDNGNAYLPQEHQLAGVLKAITINAQYDGKDVSVVKAKNGNTSLHATLSIMIPQLAKFGLKTRVRRRIPTSFLVLILEDESNADALGRMMTAKALKELIVICKDASEGTGIAKSVTKSCKAVKIMADFDQNTKGQSYYDSNDVALFELAQDENDVDDAFDFSMLGRTPIVSVYHTKSNFVFRSFELLGAKEGDSDYAEALQDVVAHKAQLTELAKAKDALLVEEAKANVGVKASNAKAEFQADMDIKVHNATKVSSIEVLQAVAAMSDKEIANLEALGINVTDVVKAELARA